MSNRFTAPDEGLSDRPPIEQREGELDEVFALREMAMQEIRTDTDRLALGSITVPTWRDLMRDILATYYLSGWQVGAGGSEPDDAQLDSLAEALADQYVYLEGFIDDLLELPAGALPDRERNRAELYGWATGAAYWRGFVGFDLPFYPKERCECHVGCACGWLIDVLDAEAGDYDATWVLGSTEHCQTCLARSSLRPLEIRGGAWAASQVSSGMYA